MMVVSITKTKGMRWLVIILVAISVQHAEAYTSGIAIQTDKNSAMQVFVNGKLRSTQAKSFIRIKSNPGLYKITIKVLNPYDKEWYVVRKNVKVVKGYEFYYKVNFSKGKRPVLELVRRYPVYSNYFLNTRLYNSHPTT